MKKIVISLFVMVLVGFGSVQYAHAETGSIDFSACSGIKTTGLTGIVNCGVGFLNAAIYLLMSLAVVFTVYGAFVMISSEEKREEGKNKVIYGIIGLFAMVSIWGFVNILNSTFGLGTSTALPAPKINPL